MILLNGREIDFTMFPNGETNVPHKTIREAYNYEKENIITLKYENDSDLIRLMFVKKHLDRFHDRNRLVIAYMPYSRMDRVEDGSVFTLKYVADFINSLNFAGANQDSMLSAQSLGVNNWTTFSATLDDMGNARGVTASYATMSKCVSSYRSTGDIGDLPENIK